MSTSARELLARADLALARLDWAQVHALACDVLVLEPENAEARVLRELAEQRGAHASLPGRLQATALFADLVGSTPIAERHDVEVYTEALRTFVDACTPAILRHDGHLMGVQGDGVVACFGYPNAHEDDACRAVTAGLELLATLRTAAADLTAAHGIELQGRVGIDTGLIMVDGVEIAGGVLNRASRLQGLAAPGTVLLGEATHRLVGDRFETRALGSRELKGVATPVEVFRVLRPRERSPLEAASQSASLPFVGRDDELARALGAWEEAVAPPAGGDAPNRAAVLLITGEPGIGKSRLAGALVTRIRPDATRVLQLDCSSYTATSTLASLRATVARYAGLHTEDTAGERLAKLEALCTDLAVDPVEAIPVLGTLLGVDLAGRYPPLDVSPAQLQRVLLERLTALLAAISTGGPAVVLVEDLHWADPATLELLDRFAAAGLEHGLLIVGTARPGLEWVPGHGAVRTISLPPLSAAEAEELALAVGSDRMSRADAREVAARGDGVPLFVEQLAQLFDGTGIPGSAESVPQTLIQLLQARLDAVSEAKLVAQVAATIGREFPLGLLQRVLSARGGGEAAGAGSLERHLKELADADLVEPMPVEGLLRFRHVLMRDAAYQSQLLRDRRARHGAVAEILADAGDPALTAFHFESAERPVEALVHYLDAVRAAQSAGAFPEVLAHLGRCDGLLAAVPDENLRARFELGVRVNRGFTVSSTAGYVAPAVVAEYGRARQLCDQLSDAPGVAEDLLKTLFGLWSYYVVSGDMDTSANICTAIEHQLGRATIQSGWYCLQANRGAEALGRGNVRIGERLLSAAVDGMARDGINPAEWWQPQDPLAASLAVLGLLRFERGDETGALAAIRSGLARGEPLEFPRGPFSVAFVRNYEAALHHKRRDAAASAAAASEMISIGERHGFADWQLVGRLRLLAANALTDDTTASLDGMAEALRIWQSVGAEFLVPPLYVRLAEGYLALDELERAQTHLDQAFQDMRRGQRLGLSDAMWLRAELRLRADESATAAATADLRKAITIARDQGNMYYLLRAALAYLRLLPEEPSESAQAALMEAVSAYRDAAGFPDLALGRTLVNTGDGIRCDSE